MSTNQPAVSWSSSHPHLRGAFAPVWEERDDKDLLIEGEIPAGLNGTYMRNGPNPRFEPDTYIYPIDGTGMIHAVYLNEGRARYRNRWVRTAEFLQEEAAGHRIFGSIFGPGPKANLANTHIVPHAGRILALWEGGKPHLMDRELATLGSFDFQRRLPGAMSAHPKIDPETGEMIAVAYDAATCDLNYLVIDRAGALRTVITFSSPWPAMVHDIAVTRNYVVAIVCPYVLGQPAPEWRPSLGTAIAVIPRRGSDRGIQWLETHPFFHFHVMNAFEKGDGIEIQLPWFSSYGAADTQHRLELHRLWINLQNRTVRDEPLDDQPCEFPRINDAYAMRENRYGYVALRNPRPNETVTTGSFEAIARYDFHTRNRVTRVLPPGEFAGETVFVPAVDAKQEGDGFLLTFTYDAMEDRSRFEILDARNLEAEPVARIQLPCRVPAGLHGSWIPDPVTDSHR